MGTAPGGRIGTRHPATGRALTAAVACATALLLAGCSGSTTPTATTAGAWSAPVHPGPAGQPSGYAGIYGVSCPTPGFCVAVDGSGDAYRWNGSTWSAPMTAYAGNTMNSVSCSSASFCEALSSQEAVTFDGTAWSAPVAVGPAPTGPDGGQYEVSCVSPTFCGSVNTAGVVTLWDGTSWGHDAVVDQGTATKPVQNISCATPTSCVVVSATGNIATFDGRSWTTRPSPGQSLLHSVSCPTTRFCMAVDLTGHVLVSDGSTWSVGQPVPGAGALTFSVSCPTSTLCRVARSDGSVATWQSGAWGPTRAVLTDGSLASADISCPTTTFCALGDSAGAVATFRG